MKMNMSDIIVTEAFKKSIPKQKKVKKYRDYWYTYGKQRKCIEVDSNNVLTDGYIQYLILKENGVGKATVKKKYKNTKTNNSYKNNKTTYIYGIHPNSECTKEYIWRIPNSWEENKHIEIGDTVLCQTKFGISPVIVTKIEILDKCPVDCIVKKVIKKYKTHNCD